MTQNITPEQRTAVHDALLSPDLTLTTGVGDATVPGQGSACTISEIILTLTGTLSDGPHPCICDVIRRWVIRVQDAMPDEIRNSPAWRTAAVGIAGSASTPAVQRRRREHLMTWMWEALGDEAVLAAVPAAARPSWDRMLAERTAAAGYAAAAAARVAAAAADVSAAAAAAYAAYTAARAAAARTARAAADAAAARVAAAAAYADAAVRNAYWTRRDLPGTLAALIAITEEGS